MPTKAELEARIISDGMEMTRRGARILDLVNQLKASDEAHEESLNNIDIMFGRRTVELNDSIAKVTDLEMDVTVLKNSIVRKTREHYDTKQEHNSLQKQMDLVGGALELEKDRVTELERVEKELDGREYTVRRLLGKLMDHPPSAFDPEGELWHDIAKHFIAQ